MQAYFQFRTAVAIAAIVTAAIAQNSYAQDAPRTESRPREGRPLPPRIAPADYQSHAQAGAVTVAADFVGHSVPTPDGTFSTEYYVVVESALYGSEGAHLNLSYKDFSLRINGKKGALSAQPYELVFGSLKNPDWEPPVRAESQSKSSVNTSGGGQAADVPPPPAKMPMPLVLAMEQKVKMASIPEGDRALPAAGLIFFQYGGKISGIHSIELIYAGAAGKVTLPLQ